MTFPIASSLVAGSLARKEEWRVTRDASNFGWGFWYG